MCKLQFLFSIYDLLYKLQSGFKANYSCETVLTAIADDWITAIDNNEKSRN